MHYGLQKQAVTSLDMFKRLAYFGNVYMIWLSFISTFLQAVRKVDFTSRKITGYPKLGGNSGYSKLE